MQPSRLILLLLILACCLPASAAAAGPPTIQYFAPDPLRNQEATLNYAVDPEGLETEYWIEYGSAPGEYFEHNYPWLGELPAGDEPVMLSALIPAHFQGPLRKGTTYYWRAVAKNSAGTTEGPEQQFSTTNGLPARGITGGADALSLTSARLEGQVDPEGTLLTGCRFRYMKLSAYNAYKSKGFEGANWLSGKMERYGPTVPCEQSLAQIGSGLWPVPVQAEVTGLDPVPYLFRVEGDNDYEFGIAGQPISFGPPAIWTLGSDSVTATEATVSAEVEKHWSNDPIFRAEYERDGQWQQTPWQWTPDGSGRFTLSVELTCLQPDSEYRYRFAADNQSGTVYSAVQTLATLPGAAACVEPPPTSPPPAVPSTAATPPAATPPAATPPTATPKPRKKKRKSNQRKRLRSNATIVAPR